MKHELKILNTYFDAVCSGIKPFEVRKNDRNFQVGDMIRLREVEGKENEYTGRVCKKYVTYILPLKDFGNDDYVVLGLNEYKE